MISLDDRMKEYENVNRTYLSRRSPAIIRVDGKAFHTLTKHMVKPWDSHFKICMLYAAQRLCEHIQGAKLAFWQSDEISVLFTDYDTLETDAWFKKNVQKIASVSASIATAYFNQMYGRVFGKPEDYHTLALFDSRCFVLPLAEVCNYFVWRQRDATTNSINMLGQANFSHKELHGLNTDEVQNKLFTEKGINWNDEETWKKRGACVIEANGHWIIDEEIPIFSKQREYIEKLVNIEEPKGDDNV